MAVKQLKCGRGFTLVEVMVATVVLLVAVLGASLFRYQAVFGVRKADLRTTAARTALMLCESWRGTNEPNSFDPMQLASGDANCVLAIESSYVSLEVPSGFTVLGIYSIIINDVDYCAVLSWKDVSSGLRALNVIVGWNQRDTGTGDYMYPDKLFKLTTYVTN